MFFSNNLYGEGENAILAHFTNLETLKFLKLPILEVYDSSKKILAADERFLFIKKDIQFYIRIIAEKIHSEWTFRTREKHFQIDKGGKVALSEERVRKLLQTKSDINGVEEFESLFKKCEEVIKNFEAKNNQTQQ